LDDIRGPFLTEEERVVPVSGDQRRAIVDLLTGGLDNHEVAAEIGVSPRTVAAVKAHITMGSYGNVDSGASDAEADVEDAIGAGFGLERDLQLELRRNIEQLEEGLVVIDGGKEQVVASGRIDITARDARGTVVVIELKANLADRDAVGQILSYVGDLVEDGTQVRAILVAREFTPRAESAARSVHNLRLVRYGIQFVFR
jgi:hypothetical protein